MEERRQRIDISRIAQLLIGPKGIGLKHLRRKFPHCALRTLNQQGGSFLLASSKNEEQLDELKRRIEAAIQEPLILRNEIEASKNEKIHVFVDASNIMLSAQCLDGEKDIRIRINVSALAELVIGYRQAESKLVVGSIPGSGNVYWNKWRESRFNVVVLDRTQENHEQAVDDVLHSNIYRVINKQFPEQRTLVLLTGDGNSNHHRTNFPEIIEDALMKNWIVELWSWSHSTSTTYDAFSAHYPGRFILKPLNDFRDLVLFSKENALLVAAAGGGSEPRKVKESAPKSTEPTNTQKSSNNLSPKKDGRQQVERSGSQPSINTPPFCAASVPVRLFPEK